MQQPLFDALSPSAVKEELCALWKEAFGDSREYIDAFFEAFSCDDCAHTLSLGGRVVSVLYALPVTLLAGGRERPAVYIYATATAVDCRGRGYMRLLMERVEGLLFGKGVEFIYLLPASEALRGYYSRLGYVDCSKRASEVLCKPSTVHRDMFFEEVACCDALCDFCTAMQRAREPSIVHSRAFFAMNYANCRMQGGGVYVVYHEGVLAAAAFVVAGAEGPLAVERYSLSAAADDFMIQSLCSRFGTGSLRALVSGAGDALCMCRAVPPLRNALPDVNISLLLDK